MPWAVEKKQKTKSQHIGYDLQSVCVYFLVTSFLKRGVSRNTRNAVGSDCFLKNAVH